MKVTNIKRQRIPYVTKKQLAEELEISPNTVKTRIQEIEEEIQKGRYEEYAVMRDGQLLAVNYMVWIDYITYRQRLREKNLRKFVPPFDPKKIASYAGINESEAV
mgnify:CR=1 FL=1